MTHISVFLKSALCSGQKEQEGEKISQRLNSQPLPLTNRALTLTPDNLNIATYFDCSLR